MSLHEMFALISRRHRSNQSDPDEEGRTISRRLQELIAVTESEQVKAPTTEACPEDSPGPRFKHALANKQAPLDKNKAEHASY